MARLLKPTALLSIIILITQNYGSEALPTNSINWKSSTYEESYSDNDIFHVVKNDDDLQTNEISHTGFIDYAASFFDILKIKKVRLSSWLLVL